MEKDMYKYYEDNLFLPIVPKVYKYKVTLKNPVHEALKSLSRVFQTKRQRKNSNSPKDVPISVLQMSPFLMVTWWYPFTRSSLENTEDSFELFVKSRMLGRGYRSSLMTLFKWRFSLKGRQELSGLGTIWRGKAQGLSEWQITPAISIFWNSALARANFTWSKWWGRA